MEELDQPPKTLPGAHFTKLPDGRRQCMYCSTAYAKNGSTSRLRAHLLNFHKDLNIALVETPRKTSLSTPNSLFGERDGVEEEHPEVKRRRITPLEELVLLAQHEAESNRQYREESVELLVQMRNLQQQTLAVVQEHVQLLRQLSLPRD